MRRECTLERQRAWWVGSELELHCLPAHTLLHLFFIFILKNNHRRLQEGAYTGSPPPQRPWRSKVLAPAAPQLLPVPPPRCPPAAASARIPSRDQLLRRCSPSQRGSLQRRVLAPPPSSKHLPTYPPPPQPPPGSPSDACAAAHLVGYAPATLSYPTPHATYLPAAFQPPSQPPFPRQLKQLGSLRATNDSSRRPMTSQHARAR